MVACLFNNLIRNMKNLKTFKLLPFLTIVLSLFFSCFLSSNAQNIKELKKENKQYINELKIQGYKSVKIQIGDNGFWYFLVSKKVDGKKVYGVISKDKEVLFDCKYTSVNYISQIEKAGYTDYTFRSYEGGRGTVSIYNYAMPGHFTLYESGSDKTSIALIDGSIVKEFSDDYYRIGSWIITNMKIVYTRFVNFQKLYFQNVDTKNMGIMTWDGKTIANNVNNLIIITSKSENTYNNAFVFCDYHGYKVGGFYLEDLSVIAPPDYDQISFDYSERKINVKLSPTDKMHEYNPNIVEKFIPKNKGEEYFNKNKYRECIEYYAKEGVADPDSKFYSAHAMYNIAFQQISELANHVSAPSVNPIKEYDYYESKSLLQNAIEILKLASIQDTIRRDIYNENIQDYKKELNRLEENNSKLAVLKKKENSFGNKLAESLLTGLAEGIAKGAANALFGTPSSSKSNNTKSVSSNKGVKSSSPSHNNTLSPSITSSGSNSSSSDSEEEDSSSSMSKSSEPRYRECGMCNGKGEIFSTSSVAAYGLDKKVTCNVCGEEHWQSTVHHHKKCHNCHGTGKVKM